MKNSSKKTEALWRYSAVGRLVSTSSAGLHPGLEAVFHCLCS